MTGLDTFERWKEQWLAERPPRAMRISELRVEVARRRRRLALVVVGEVVLTIVLIVLTVSILRAEQPVAFDARIWLAVLWLTWAAAVAFSAWNRTLAWASQSGQSHLEQVEHLARMRLRTAAFVLVLTALLTVTLLGLGWATPANMLLAILYMAWALCYGSRARRDLAHIRRIAAEFGEDDGPV